MSVTLERIKELRAARFSDHNFIHGVLLQSDEAAALLDLAERSLTGHIRKEDGWLPIESAPTGRSVLMGAPAHGSGNWGARQSGNGGISMK